MFRNKKKLKQLKGIEKNFLADLVKLEKSLKFLDQDFKRSRRKSDIETILARLEEKQYLLYTKIGKAKGLHCPSKIRVREGDYYYYCPLRQPSSQDSVPLEDLYQEYCYDCSLRENSILTKLMMLKIENKREH